MYVNIRISKMYYCTYSIIKEVYESLLIGSKIKVHVSIKNGSILEKSLNLTQKQLKNAHRIFKKKINKAYW